MTIENVLFYLDNFANVRIKLNGRDLISGYVCVVCDKFDYSTMKLSKIDVKDNIVIIKGYQLYER